MTRARIEDHPAYPFRAGWQEPLMARARAFLDAPAEGSDHAGLLFEFVTLVRRFAFLETLIQGDVLYEIPMHREILERVAEVDPEGQGESLAEAERDLLDWRAGGVDDLAEALDEIGIKVFYRREEALAADDENRSHDLCGAFCFEGADGPALLTGAIAHHPAANFILAHEFGHLVADIDPYTSRFCRWDARTLENRSDSIEELRADRFARALLLPEDLLRQTLVQAEPAGSAGAVDPRWELITTLYRVPPALVAARLEEIGLPSLDRPAPRPKVPARPGAPAGDRIALPERFVNLALASYSLDVLDPGALARFLRVTLEEAQEILRWAQIPRKKIDLGVAGPEEKDAPEASADP